MADNSQSMKGAAMYRRMSTGADEIENQRSHAGGSGSVGQNTKMTGCFDFLKEAVGCLDPADAIDSGETLDILCIGGGIMSLSVAVMAQMLEPSWKIRVYERLSAVGEEASNGWNNAGTGHAALCELNYTPEGKDGVIDISKAIAINEKFQVSRQWWAWLVKNNMLNSDVTSFINPTPHMTFVHGAENVKFLKRRYDLLIKEPLFQGMEYSENQEQIRRWSPLLFRGKRDPNEALAATHMEQGSDVDYGALSKQLGVAFMKQGGDMRLNHEIHSLYQNQDGSWTVIVYKKDLSPSRLMKVRAKFVFVGAGGASLQVLQKSGIPEIRGFGGFPISGEFLVCQNPAVVNKHVVKIYGKAACGAPPMSVPHLDARVIDGKEMILFGPYAGFSPKYLKNGSMSDMFSTLKPHNIIPMAAAGLQNLDLTLYLIKEVLATKEKKLDALKEFIPDAKGEDWTVCTAGQRVQIMKKDAQKIGILQFGTEIVASEDGTIAGLLGASPGASVSVQVAIDVLSKCFGEKKLQQWTPKFKDMIPSFGQQLNGNKAYADQIMRASARLLKIDQSKAPQQ